MKHLKKLFALALAVVMVFTLCVFADAGFADGNKISLQYADACGVMNGLGILKGDQNGNFDPQGTLTRGQAAKIITYLKLGKQSDNLKATSAPFDDVPTTAWEAPFVAYCKNARIIAGYGNGKFGKDDKLSGYAFGKMLLTMVGYGAKDEYIGSNWKLGVANDALATGLFSGIEEYLTDSPLPREVAAQLAFNAAQIQPVTYAAAMDYYMVAGQPLCVYPLDFNPAPITSTDDNGNTSRTFTNQAGNKIVFTRLVTAVPYSEPAPSVPTPAASPTYSTIAAGGYVAAINADGTVVANGPWIRDDPEQDKIYVGPRTEDGWTDIVSISAGYESFSGLKKDGTVVTCGLTAPVQGWSNIVAISAAGERTVGLKADGTVVVAAPAFDNFGENNVSSWKDIVAISAAPMHTVGLKKDGTVVAVGNNNDGQCNVSGWSNVIAISAGGDYTVGIKADGTVLFTGGNYYGESSVRNWKNIVSISAGGAHIVGLKADGTVVAVGLDDGRCDVSSWSNIVSVYAGDYGTIGLRTNGTLAVAGYTPYEIEAWSGIKLP